MIYYCVVLYEYFNPIIVLFLTKKEKEIQEKYDTYFNPIIVLFLTQKSQTPQEQMKRISILL